MNRAPTGPVLPRSVGGTAKVEGTVLKSIRRSVPNSAAGDWYMPNGKKGCPLTRATPSSRSTTSSIASSCRPGCTTVPSPAAQARDIVTQSS